MLKDNINFQCDFCSSHTYRIKKSLNRRLGIEHSKFNVVKCSDCGLISLYPIPDESNFAAIYADYAIKKERLSVESKRINIYNHKLEKLKKYNVGTNLLDIGAGLGTFIKCAKEYGYDAIGIEYEKDQCELAREIYGINLINLRFEDAYENLSKNSFDIINLHHVLEHVISPKKVLGMINHLLKKNGVLLIEVPNQFCNIKKNIEYSLFNRFKYPDNSFHHIHFFSIKTLRNYLKLYHFEILELNQFRTREKSIRYWERIPKDLYRCITTRLRIGGGSFIEVYCKK